MSRPLLRRVSPLAAALTLTFLASAARADPPGEPVRIDGPDDVTVMRSTGAVANVPVATRWGYYTVPSPVYAPICGSGSCTGSLPAGQYTLGVSKDGGAVVEGDDPVEIYGATTIHATYHDRTLWRALGVTTLVASTLGGAALAFSKHISNECVGGGPATPPTQIPGTATDGNGNVIGGVVATVPGSPATPCTPTSVVTYPYVAEGAAVIAAGALASLVMLLQHDSVSFTVSPFSVGAIPGARETAGAGSIPNGLELTMRF